MEQAGVMVEGSDLRDVRSKIMRGERRPWITIEPVENHEYSDAHRFRTTERFTICWDGRGECFTRQVNSVAELCAVLKPIFAAKKRDADAAKKEIEECCKNQRRSITDEARQKLKEAKKNLELSLRASR